MEILNGLTRCLFFTGKGGVGKTTMACAIAVQLADAGRRVLLVSTDPASNLDEVLGTVLSGIPTAIDSVPGLSALNIDPEVAAAEYREEMVGPYRGVLPDVAIASMEEQFSGSCTVEIAAFDQFARLLGSDDATSRFDHVIFDTAPTGHTLRLLTLPSAWTGFIESNTSGTSCLGPLAGLQKQQTLYQRTVEALSDPNVTTLALVTRPETAALQEAARTAGELHALDVSNQHLIVNGIFQCQRRPHSKADPVAVAMQERCETALKQMPAALSLLARTNVPLLSTSLVGIEALRKIGQPAGDQMAASSEPTRSQDLPSGLESFIDELAAPGHGVLMTMGKGGVGKTTIAAAVAVALADRGFQVHLTTTDPAAHVADVLGGSAIDGLTISRIDPKEVTAAYRDEVLNNAGQDLDADGRALLEEDLRSPCTEEIAVFRAFADAVSAGEKQFVVLDTAPTGHTILLLDAALAYHKELSRQTHEIPDSVQGLLPRLRDPKFTRVLIVTLPEATPVHEAQKLQADLQRATISPFGWVINRSLAPLSVTDEGLVHRQQNERPYIHEVADSIARRTAIVPWQLQAPIGGDRLRALNSGE